MAENFRCHKVRERVHSNELTRLFLRTCAYGGHESLSGVLSVIRDPLYQGLASGVSGISVMFLLSYLKLKNRAGIPGLCGLEGNCVFRSIFLAMSCTEKGFALLRSMRSCNLSQFV
jgi:hypothetical protein